MTAAFGLFQRLYLPSPWHPTLTPIPLIIYGAASAVGSYAIQLAQQANIHPLICVAGRGIPHVESLIDRSKGDVVLDYRVGDKGLVQNLKAAVEKAGGKVEYAFDAVSEHGSYQNICEVLDHKAGKITLVLPGKDYKEIPSVSDCSGFLSLRDMFQGYLTTTTLRDMKKEYLVPETCLKTQKFILNGHY